MGGGPLKRTCCSSCSCGFLTVRWQPYLAEVSRQISCHFKDNLGLFTALNIFKPQKCPTDVEQLHQYTWHCTIADASRILLRDNRDRIMRVKSYLTPADVNKYEGGSPGILNEILSCITLHSFSSWHIHILGHIYVYAIVTRSCVNWIRRKKV